MVAGAASGGFLLLLFKLVDAFAGGIFLILHCLEDFCRVLVAYAALLLLLLLLAVILVLLLVLLVLFVLILVVLVLVFVLILILVSSCLKF